MSERPFKVLGVHHIAIGAPDKTKPRKLWDMLGLEFIKEKTMEGENVIEDILKIGTGPLAVEIDLMQPFDPEKKPDVSATPLGHFGLWVDDLPKAVEWLTANGVRFAANREGKVIRMGAAGYDITFLHPKGNDEFPISGNGVLIELVQAPQEVIAAYAKIMG